MEFYGRGVRKLEISGSEVYCSGLNIDIPDEMLDARR